MGPIIDLGKSGVPAGTSAPDLPATYRRRLKGSQPDAAPSDATEMGGAPTDASTVVWKELRQSPRFRCSGSVEFRLQFDNECMWGTLTDVSLHGCYVDTTSTFPIGTKFSVVLKSFGIRIQSLGTVRTSYPSKGMGIGYTEMEQAEQQKLNHLLEKLNDRALPIAGSPRNAAEVSLALDPKSFFDEMTQFFRKNQTLSREEFDKMAIRVRRI